MGMATTFTITLMVTMSIPLMPVLHLTMPAVEWPDLFLVLLLVYAVADAFV
jgi:hypothetical protein